MSREQIKRSEYDSDKAARFGGDWWVQTAHTSTGEPLPEEKCPHFDSEAAAAFWLKSRFIDYPEDVMRDMAETSEEARTRRLAQLGARVLEILREPLTAMAPGITTTPRDTLYVQNIRRAARSFGLLGEEVKP